MTIAQVRADALRIPMRSGSAQMAITSPPYFGKVSYGNDPLEHGLTSLQSYLDAMLMMSAEVYRVLDDEGHFFLNIGDTQANSGGAGGDHNKGGKKSSRPKYKQGYTGVQGNQMLLIPEKLAIGLQVQGWMIRKRIIWEKANRVRPEGVAHVRRPLDQHEIVWMLGKSNPKNCRYVPEAHEKLQVPLGDVWSIAPVRNKTGHPAPFPPELVRRALMIASRPGDVVIDPYVGSGTAIREAARHQRIGLGFDLYAGLWEEADGHVRVAERTLARRNGGGGATAGRASRRGSR